MSTTLHCSCCGDPITEYKDVERRIGRCCFNLPGAWTDEQVEYAFETGEPGDPTPTYFECSCGSTRFVVRETRYYSGQLDSTEEEEPSPDTLYVDAACADDCVADDLRVECRECGAQVSSANIEWI